MIILFILLLAVRKRQYLFSLCLSKTIISNKPKKKSIFFTKHLPHFIHVTCPLKWTFVSFFHSQRRSLSSLVWQAASQSLVRSAPPTDRRLHFGKNTQEAGKANLCAIDNGVECWKFYASAVLLKINNK